MKQILLYLLAITTIIACSKSDEVEEENNNETFKQPEITLDVTALSFSTDGGSKEITFTSSEVWTAEVINSRADNWCTINPTSGAAGNATITVTTEPNDMSDDRSASIVIKSGTVSKAITVNQKQKDALTVTASKFEVEVEGGEVSIEVKANIDFEYTIEESAKGWVEYMTNCALKTSNLVFNVKENEQDEKREAQITIKSGEYSETVTIYQAGRVPSFILSQNEYVVLLDGETIAVEVKSNVDVEVELPADAEWISECATRKFSTNTYYFDIAPSEEYEQRTANIKFTNKENNISEVVKITQKPKDAIVLAKSHYEFSANGGDIDLEIQTNVDFVVTISEDAQSWIEHLETRTMETKTLFFRVWEFSDYEDREGSITISGGDATQIVTVKQLGLKRTLEKERKALIEFYKATGGDNWINNTNWCSDKPIDEWYGIDTHEDTGMICRLILNRNNLVGNIPEQIGELSNLRTLWLNDNHLSGELPLSMTNLLRLEDLSLANNHLSGKVSHIIPKFRHLSLLDLNDNNFTGDLPEIHNYVEYMNFCGLKNNLFTGNIPESYIRAFGSDSNDDVYNTYYGWRYDIQYNNLTGKIPASMANHKNWVAHWREIVPQNPGYGFDKVDLPAPQIVVKCFDDSFLDLAEEYKSHQYTMIFRWDPNCIYSQPYIHSIYQLYNKYKDKGLGLLCTTRGKFSLEIMEPLMSVCKDVKVFWENSNDSWDNNPMSLGGFFFLFRSGATPYFHIVDNNGNIVFYGSGDCGNSTVPQYHANRDDIFDFVATLFGAEKYE